jgi:hypothetical protein
MLTLPLRDTGMKTKRTVIICGNHLAMSTIFATLREKPGFCVRQVGGLLSDVIQNMEVDPPDVLLFDLAVAQPDFAIPLMRKHPTVMLVGVDLTSNKMLVLSGEHSRLLTPEDLMSVIEGSPRRYPYPLKEPHAPEAGTNTKD